MTKNIIPTTGSYPITKGDFERAGVGEMRKRLDRGDYCKDTAEQKAVLDWLKEKGFDEVARSIN